MAEGAPLLRVYRGNSIEGSNPSLSAIREPTDYPVAIRSHVGFEPEIIKTVGLSAALEGGVAQQSESFSYCFDTDAHTLSVQHGARESITLASFF